MTNTVMWIIRMHRPISLQVVIQLVVVMRLYEDMVACRMCSARR